MAHDPQIEKTPAEVAAALEQGDVQLVDVRTAEELAEARFEGARHVELSALTGQADSIDRDRPVVFVCRSGSRSLMAAQAFKQAGFDAWSMSGGLLEWEAEGRPVVRG